MYLPRSLISQLYVNLTKTHHPLSPPVLILVGLDPDALCACRILAALLKSDYIPHKIQPITGYGDLSRAGRDLVQPMRLADGGSGGVVVCVGIGGLVDLEMTLGLEPNEDGSGGFDGVSIWLFDSRRPWNLSNVFAGPAITADTEHGLVKPRRPEVEKGQITRSYRSENGGIVVFDDGDVEEDLLQQRESWFALEEMPEVDDDGYATDASDVDSEDETAAEGNERQRKRKSSSIEDDAEFSGSENDDARPHQRRRSNSSTPIPSSPPPDQRSARIPAFDSTPPSNQDSSPLKVTQPQPSARTLRNRLLNLRRKHDAVIRNYHAQGTSYSEPISSLMYSLASELGREDNDLLWLTIVGVSSTELYGRTSTGLSLTDHDAPQTFTGWSGSRGLRVRQILHDEVRRLNPPELTITGHEVARGHATDSIPTNARSPTDSSIRLSPEPRFLLIRHWSLYDSMLHSPYLAAKLHIWSDAGRRRLHKLLAKMGVSLAQSRQFYPHMDMDLKRVLRERLLKYAPHYGLDGLIPPPPSAAGDRRGWGFVRSWGWKACLSATDVAVIIGAILEMGHIERVTSQSPDVHEDTAGADDLLPRFYAAYDALLSPSTLTNSIPLAQSLHQAILRTGTSLLAKRQVRHLRAFRMAVIKDGPDAGLFRNAGALTKLALWVGEAVGEVERGGGQVDGLTGGKGAGPTPLVLACADDARGIYVVVGLGGGGDAATAARETRAREETERKRKEKEAKRAAVKAQKAEARAQARERRRQRARNNSAEEDDGEESDSASSENSSSEESGSESESEALDEVTTPASRRNKFGNAFHAVAEETGARVRLDSFDHCVVEVRKEDLSGFLEGLSMRAVIG